MTGTTSFDPARFKADAHQDWQTAAPGWHTWSETMETEEGSRALSRILVDRARLRAGDTVLDVGAGYGEPGLTAAEAIAPGGRLVLQDLAADMLACARQRMEAAGPRGVEVTYLEGDVETLELEPGRFDAIVSRAALMLCVDVAGTLRRLRSSLAPGGRLAASVWDTPESVGFASPLPVILDALELPPPPKDRPSPFALGDRERLASVVADAGFEEVQTGSETVVWEFPSREACTRFIRDVAPPITNLVAGQPNDVQQHVWQRVTNEAWEPYAEPDGRIRLRNRGHWVAAANPR